uniref:Abasic site processing protein HMCES n=5 Tax=Clastoptera arizonana TaxID=38151 RepID=A0A1B6D327_9HEMI
MCGRISCHMCKEDCIKATRYYDEAKQNYESPEWYESPNCPMKFNPSPNIAPTDISPVLISGDHYNKETKRVLQPMMFGMIPHWHKGDYKTHKLSTNNCRIEGINSSKLFNIPLKLGQRCVVVCDGYYEWQAKNSGQSKQPYFVYTSQKNIQEKDPNCPEKLDEDSTEHGPTVLMMAGLYDKWTNIKGEEFFSYSVITMESNNTLSWLHHRMPAILQSEEDISKWLDFKHVGSDDALQHLRPVECVTWHPVSTLVNNSKNKDTKCNKPIDLKKPSASSTFMDSWLRKSDQTKRSSDFDELCVLKKSKKE